MSQYVGQPLEYTKTNPTWMLEEERKKVLQEAIKNFGSTSFPAGRPEFGEGINKPAVMPNDEIQRIENAKANLIKAQQVELAKMIGRYKVNKRTNILKVNPNKKDGFGDVGTDIVGTLEAGDIIDIAKQGGGGRGAEMTPYLIFSDDTYILGYDADKVDNSTPLTPKLLSTPNSFLQANRKQLLLLLAVVAGYFAYKKFKK
jgi:hypothetical protein